MSDSSASPAILITGGSRGIGRATALELAAVAGTLILAATGAESLEKVTQQLADKFPATRVVTYAIDIADEAAVKGMFQDIHKDIGSLDALVNAAGVMLESPLGMTRQQDLQRLFEVNVFGSYYCCQYASRLMSRCGNGAIVNLASTVGEQGAAGQSAYAASKSAISGLTRSLAKELGPSGVRVNAVAPGFIETDMTAHYQEERRRKVVDGTLLGRAGTPEEVASLIGFLVSPEASYITGQVITIAGGLKL